MRLRIYLLLAIIGIVFSACDSLGQTSNQEQKPDEKAPIDSSKYIKFADSAVEFICLSKWDKNWDRLLSYEEAASVTRLSTNHDGSLFFNNEEIHSFDELQYFTGVDSIETLAFWGCKNLSSITLPPTISKIGVRAFEDCNSLKGMTIWKAADIGNSAFSHLNFEYFNAPEGLRNVGEFALSYIPASMDITIVEGATEIGRSAFHLCTGLKSIVIPASMKVIGDYAFNQCTALTDISILGSADIGQGAFTGCETAISVNAPAGLRNVQKWGFAYVPANMDITINEGATIIGEEAFRNSGLISISIPSTVSCIGTRAFSLCEDLRSVTLSEGIETIEDSAFAGCTKLSEIIIPSSVTIIGKGSFSSCSISSLTILGPADIGDDAFNGVTVFSAPAGLRNIGHAAFSGCTAPMAITIVEGATMIGGAAFMGCTGLYSVVIPSTISTISNDAFCGCTGLKDITIPEGVSIIEDDAFKLCPIEYLTIPSTVTSIGSLAFYGNRKKSITMLPITPPTLGKDLALGVIAEDGAILVPAESLNAYKTAAGWEEYSDYIKPII